MTCFMQISAFQKFKTVKHKVASEIVFTKSANNSMVWLEWRALSARVSRTKSEIKRKEGSGEGAIFEISNLK